MKVSKMFRFGIFALLVSTMFIACSEDEGIDNILGEDDENHVESFFSMFDEVDEVDLGDCVEFVYPLTLTNADGTTTTINDEAALEQALINAINSATPPTLVFPIQVLDDGQTVSVTTEEELCDLFMECWEEDEDDCDCHGDDEECFEINYPITLVMPDGTQAVVNNDDELETTIDNYYDNNPNDNGDVTVVYPVSLTLIENDSIVTVNSDEELDDLFDLCFDEEFEECFEIQFPLSFSMPDGSTLTANTEEELDSLYEAWVQANPNATTDPQVIFPITVIMLEDNSTVTINTEEELEELFEDCYDDICDDIDPSDIIIGKASTTVNRIAAKKQKIKQK